MCSDLRISANTRRNMLFIMRTRVAVGTADAVVKQKERGS